MDLVVNFGKGVFCPSWHTLNLNHLLDTQMPTVRDHYTAIWDGAKFSPRCMYQHKDMAQTVKALLSLKCWWWEVGTVILGTIQMMKVALVMWWRACCVQKLHHGLSRCRQRKCWPSSVVSAWFQLPRSWVPSSGTTKWHLGQPGPATTARLRPEQQGRHSEHIHSHHRRSGHDTERTVWHSHWARQGHRLHAQGAAWQTVVSAQGGGQCVLWSRCALPHYLHHLYLSRLVSVLTIEVLNINIVNI